MKRRASSGFPVVLSVGLAVACGGESVKVRAPAAPALPPADAGVAEAVAPGPRAGEAPPPAADAWPFADAPAELTNRCERVAEHVMAQVRLGDLDRDYYRAWCVASNVSAEHEACFLAARELVAIARCEVSVPHPEEFPDPVAHHWCTEMTNHAEALRVAEEPTANDWGTPEELALVRESEVGGCVSSRPTRSAYRCVMASTTVDEQEACR